MDSISYGRTAPIKMAKVLEHANKLMTENDILGPPINIEELNRNMMLIGAQMKMNSSFPFSNIGYKNYDVGR